MGTHQHTHQPNIGAKGVNELTKGGPASAEGGDAEQWAASFLVI